MQSRLGAVTLGSSMARLRPQQSARESYGRAPYTQLLTDPPIPDSLRPLIDDETAAANLAWARPGSLVLVVWVVVQIVLDSTVLWAHDGPLLLVFDLVAAGMIAVFAVLVHRGLGSIPTRRVIDGAALAAVVWTAAYTSFFGSALTQLVVVVLIAALLRSSLRFRTILFALSIVVVGAFEVARAGSASQLSAMQTTEIVFAAILGWTVSLQINRSFVHRVLAEARVRLVVAGQEELIERRTGELREVAAGLGERLREREVLIREIHHRVGNNLQVILSLIKLSECGGAERLSRLEQRVASLATAYRLAQDSESLDRVDLRDYLMLVVDAVGESHGALAHCSVRQEIPPIHVPVGDAAAIGMIVSEAYANCLIHAGAAASRAVSITISVVARAESLTIRVADDGLGIPAGATPAPGLGLALIEALVDQLSGTHEIRPHSGFELEVVCPCPATADSVLREPRDDAPAQEHEEP